MFRSILSVICFLLSLPCVNDVVKADQGSVATILGEFSPFDLNQDGVAEIHSLRCLNSQPENEGKTSDERLLLVLVEKRLLDHDQEYSAADGGLVARLTKYCAALRRDGWAPLLVVADIQKSEIHQDGRSVLAMRRLFQSLKKHRPDFAGAILVGSFPEPSLVRRWLWKHSDRAVTFGEVKYNTKGNPSATWLAIKPELISARSDVVLCDLDGKWEEIYHQESTAIEVVSLLPEEAEPGAWPDPAIPLVTSKFSLGKRSFEDFFYINDAQYSHELDSDGKLRFKGSYEMRLPEVSDADRQDPNPLARPEIMVSRINALHVAVSQPAGNLDENGKPKASAKEGGSPNGQFFRDVRLELQLLCEYFDRNLSHRRGETATEARRVAVMTTDLHTPSKGYFQKTIAQLGGVVEFPKATALDFSKFMATPAIVKGVSAHSNASCSVLMKGYEASALDAFTGGHYWNWREKGAEFAPTYNDPRVRNSAHFALLRTLWENGKLQGAGPCFYIHGGCEVNCPPGAARHPYHSTAYADHTQIAECFMYYGNGLALLGRAKVFYDIPTGLGESFTTERGAFGDILRGYFDIESQNAKLGKSVASRNRTYFWSILGDWTLRLSYPASSDSAP